LQELALLASAADGYPPRRIRRASSLVAQVWNIEAAKLC
jgi:hypothetical protein